jgi:large subunit ribosomal protein L21
MYAVIRAGGKQYRVAPGDVIQIDRALEADKNGNVEFGGADVLAISSEAGKIAKPNGGGASVTAEVLDEGRSAKILVFKFKRKKQYKKMQGHRQAQTTIRVTEIAYDGEKATAPKTERKPKKQAEASAEAAPAKQAAAKGGKKSAAKKSSGKQSAAKKSSKKK